MNTNEQVGCRFEAILKQSHSNLKLTSRTKDDDAGEELAGPVEYCFDLEPECRIKCIDFDDVQKTLAKKRKIPLACSVDAVLCSSENVYAIEFKTGHVDMVNVHRKIYDTVLSWLENRQQSISYARERIVYVLVMAALSKQIKRFGHSFLGKQKPWEGISLQPNQQELRKIQGWIVRDVEIMPPEFFKRYLRYYKLTKLKL